MEFDLNKLLTDIASTTEQKQAATTQFLTVQENQQKRVASSADDLAKQGQIALDQLNLLDSEGKRVRALAESNNIIDRITLIGEQALNPNTATSAGRQKRQAELSANMALRAQLHGYTATSAQAEIGVAEAQLKGAEARQAMVLEQINASSAATEAMRVNIVQNEQLRNLKLTQFQTKELNDVLRTGAGPNGKVNLGGFEYTPTEIREQVKALEMRDRLALLAPDITAPDFAMRMDAWHQSQLATMKGEELRQLRANGGMMPDGTQVNPATIDSFIKRTDEIEMDQLLQAQNQFAANHVFPLEVQAAGQSIERLNSSIPMNSPLRADYNAYATEVAALARVAQDPNLTDAQRAVAMQRYALARTKFNEAAEKEANRRAGSDKDLRQIYYNEIIGEPQNPEQVKEVIAGRLVEQKPIASLVPQEHVTRIQNVYQSILSKKTSEESNRATFEPGFTKTNLKDLKAEAAREAIEQIGKEAISTELTRFQVQAAGIAGNPLKEVGIIPAQANAIMNESTEQAWKLTQKQFDLTDDELNTVRRGQPVQGKNLDDIGAYFRSAAFNQEYTHYERLQPGLGDKVVDWYVQNADTYLTRQIANLPSGIQPLVANEVSNAIDDLTSGWLRAQNDVKMTGARAASEYLTHDQDATFISAMTLQLDAGLNEGERKLLMDQLIRPVLANAKQVGQTDKQALELIEQAIQNVKPTDANLTNALKKHRQNRLQIQQQFSMLKKEIEIQHDRKRRDTAKQNLRSRGYPERFQPLLTLQESTLKWAYPEDEGN